VGDHLARPEGRWQMEDKRAQSEAQPGRSEKR